MPSLAQFLRDGWMEDKYSDEFNSKFSERLEHMNVAQLQGLYTNLKEKKKNSQSGIWKEANQILLDKMQGYMDKRVAESDKKM